MFFCDR